MKRKLPAVFLLLVFTAALAFAGGASEAPKAAAKTSLYPDTIVGSTSSMESGSTIVFKGVEQEFEKILGSKLRFIGVDLIMSQAVALKERKAVFWNTHLGSAYRAIFGVEEFASEQWGGPQRIRMIWRGGPNYLAMIARANSGMKTVADLKGKKIAMYPGGSGFISACLAHAGLILKDITEVPTSAYNDALRALLENRVDAAFGSTGAAIVMEISASPGGLVYLEMPASNKEGWKALQAINPSLLPMTVPEGWAGAKEAWGRQILGFPNSEYAYADADENIIYGVTKVMTEGFDSYKERHAALKSWTIENALDVFTLPVPLHAGAIRYFKEKNLWTAAMQTWQDRQVKLEDERIAAWPKALAEAKSKKIDVDIKNQEWQALWKSYLNKID
jgi:hypothetical protein